MDNQMERRWLSLFVENRAGVLARISGLFSGKPTIYTVLQLEKQKIQQCLV